MVFTVSIAHLFDFILDHIELDLLYCVNCMIQCGSRVSCAGSWSQLETWILSVGFYQRDANLVQ